MKNIVAVLAFALTNICALNAVDQSGNWDWKLIIQYQNGPVIQLDEISPDMTGENIMARESLQRPDNFPHSPSAILSYGGRELALDDTIDSLGIRNGSVLNADVPPAYLTDDAEFRVIIRRLVGTELVINGARANMTIAEFRNQVLQEYPGENWIETANLFSWDQRLESCDTLMGRNIEPDDTIRAIIINQ
jgi:hypothetical protein